MVILQDIERGKVSWRHPDQILKIRLRNTARVITPKTTRHTGRDKICNGFNDSSCRQPSDHIVNNVIHKHACSYCFEEVGKFCQHKGQDYIRKKKWKLVQTIKPPIDGILDLEQ